MSDLTRSLRSRVWDNVVMDLTVADLLEMKAPCRVATYKENGFGNLQQAQRSGKNIKATKAILDGNIQPTSTDVQEDIKTQTEVVKQGIDNVTVSLRNMMQSNVKKRVRSES